MVPTYSDFSCISLKGNNLFIQRLKATCISFSVNCLYTLPIFVWSLFFYCFQKGAHLVLGRSFFSTLISSFLVCHFFLEIVYETWFYKCFWFLFNLISHFLSFMTSRFWVINLKKVFFHCKVMTNFHIVFSWTLWFYFYI